MIDREYFKFFQERMTDQRRADKEARADHNLYPFQEDDDFADCETEEDFELREHELFQAALEDDEPIDLYRAYKGVS